MATWLNVSKLLASIESALEEALLHTRAEGLSPKQVHVLESLYINDGRKASDLARAIGTPGTSFTPILDGIEKAGLVRRQADSADRRAVRVFLTAGGESLRDLIQDTLFDLETRFADAPRLSEREQERVSA